MSCRARYRLSALVLAIAVLCTDRGANARGQDRLARPGLPIPIDEPVAQEEMPRPSPLSQAGVATAPVPTGAGARALPINLATALKLGNARNLDIALAARQEQVAAAQLQASNVLWLPNLLMGTDYYRHDGQIQDIVGNVFGTSKQGFTVGGAPYLTMSFSDAIFAPLSAKQILRAREAGLQAAANDALLAVTQAFFTVQQASGQLAGSLDALARTDNLLSRVEKLAPDVVPGLEITRTRTLLTQQRSTLLQYENNWRAASADLVRVLHLDPAVVVQPVEPPQLQVSLLALDKSVVELLEVALTNRPELAAQQALVQATLQQLRQERTRPLLPSLYVRGFSTPVTGTLAAGYFGGGINSGMGNFSFRQDWDVQLLWQLQNFGLGNRALIRQRGAQNEAAHLELLRVQDMVAAEVVRAYALAQTAAGRVQQTETELKQARELVDQNLLALGQTRRAGELVVLLVRPQEVVAAIQMLQQAYVAYFLAVADYNRAQFQLYRALGNPAHVLLSDPRCGTPLQLPEANQEPRHAVVQTAGSQDGGEVKQASASAGRPSYHAEPISGPGSTRTIRLRVRLPKDAALWLGGTKTDAQGEVRDFVANDASPDQIHVYDVRARWTDHGASIERSVQVRALAGTQITVDFVLNDQ